MRTLCVISCACVAFTLAGCASPFAPSQLEPPAKALMVPPKALPDLKAGDDLVKKHQELRREAATDKSKLRRLQKYVSTVTQK